MVWFGAWFIVLALADPKAHHEHWLMDPVSWLLISAIPLHWILMWVLFAVYALVQPPAPTPTWLGSLQFGSFNIGTLVLMIIGWLQWIIIIPFIVRRIRNRAPEKTG